MWSDIPGRAAYLWIYDEWLASNPPRGAIAVEVGVALGKSISYLARKAIDAGRHDLRIVAVDPWAGTARNGEQQSMSTPDKDFDLFLRMMREHCPEEFDRIEILRTYSVVGSERFQDGTVSLVVLDADHTAEAVMADLCAWVPTLIPQGGTIGGDDWVQDFPGVEAAVRAYFAPWKKEIETRNVDNWGTWRVRL